MTAIRIIDSHLELADIGSNTHAQIEGHIQGIGNYTFPAADGLSSQVLQTNGGGVLSWVDRFGCTDLAGCSLTNLGTRSHSDLTGIGANNHHNELHSIASHNDTSATGAQLDTLTDNSIANTLHRHSELVASDGNPDPALSVDATGQIGIGIAAPSNCRVHVYQASGVFPDGTAIKMEAGTDQHVGFSLSSNTKTWQFSKRNAAGGDALRIVYFDGVSWSPKTTFAASGNIGIGTVAPATSALLELSSTTGALLLTRMTTVQKNALTAVNGMVLYDSTLNKFQGYENGAWISLI